jgi:hypothetical protein
MRNLDAQAVARRGLQAFFYQLVTPVDAAEGAGFVRHADVLTALASWGLPVESHWTRCEGIDQVIAFCDRWADERRDSEALVVAPDGQSFYLVEKLEFGRAGVFKHPGPLVNGQAVDLERVADLTVPAPPVAGERVVTGASLHPLGDKLAVRTYGHVFEYALSPDGGLDRLDLAVPTTLVPAASELQGEAIGYVDGGRWLYTVSEDARALGDRMLHRYRCLGLP